MSRVGRCRPPPLRQDRAATRQGRRRLTSSFLDGRVPFLFFLDVVLHWFLNTTGTVNQSTTRHRMARSHLTSSLQSLSPEPTMPRTSRCTCVSPRNQTPKQSTRRSTFPVSIPTFLLSPFYSPFFHFRDSVRWVDADTGIVVRISCAV